MLEALLQRARRWWCERFGHRGEILHDCPGGGEPEVCRRCNRLLTTAWSRARNLKPRA